MLTLKQRILISDYSIFKTAIHGRLYMYIKINTIPHNIYVYTIDVHLSSIYQSFPIIKQHPPQGKIISMRVQMIQWRKLFSERNHGNQRTTRNHLITVALSNTCRNAFSDP